ncbi:MAG: hypothetical protein V1809_08250 [Planctomycetota bacterium]
MGVRVRTGGREYAANFVMLAPGPGYPSAQNIERCRVCGGRKGHCVCPR